MTTVAETFGPKIANDLAMWAIDALVEPPVRISTATTKLPRSLVERGREILDEAGVDWKTLHRKQRADRLERARAAR